MKSLKYATPVVIAALLITACSSGSGTATTTASTSAAPASTTSSASSTSSSTSSSSASSTTSTLLTGETESSGAAVELDDASKAWFNTFCTSLTTAATSMIGVAASAANTTGEVAPDQKLAIQASEYGVIAKAATDLATALSGAEPPGFDGGEEASAKIVTAFQAIGGAYDKAAKDVAAGDPANADAVIAKAEADIQATSDGLDQALGDLDSVFPSGVTDAAEKQVPSCAILASTSAGDSSSTVASTS